jgi:hypothetical protein
VWEGGFNERLGRPPAGIRISVYGALQISAASFEFLPDMNFDDAEAPLMGAP